MRRNRLAGSSAWCHSAGRSPSALSSLSKRTRLLQRVQNDNVCYARLMHCQWIAVTCSGRFSNSFLNRGSSDYKITASTLTDLSGSLVMTNRSPISSSRSKFKCSFLRLRTILINFGLAFYTTILAFGFSTITTGTTGACWFELLTQGCRSISTIRSTSSNPVNTFDSNSSSFFFR